MLIGCYQGTKQWMLIGCYQGDVNELLSRNKTIEMLMSCYQGTKQQRC